MAPKTDRNTFGSWARRAAAGFDQIPLIQANEKKDWQEKRARVRAQADARHIEAVWKEGAKPMDRLPCGANRAWPARTCSGARVEDEQRLHVQESPRRPERIPGHSEDARVKKKAPSKSALHAAMLRLDPEYVRKMIFALGRPGARGSLYADSTGFASLMYEQWHNAKYGDGSRRGFAKLHAVCTTRGLVAAFGVTRGHAGDSPMLAPMCAQLPAGSGDFCADAAYLSHANCSAIEEIGRRPVIMPKANSISNGYGARGRMIRWARASPKEFGAAYHKRSRIEAAFSSMKRLFGASLRSRKLAAQLTEAALIVACYSTHVLANL